MKRFIQGFLAAVGLIVVGVAGYVGLGLAPVATASAPLPFEQLVTGMALRARVKREAPTSSPIPPTEGVYAIGARIYRNNCAVCHGLPGQEQTAIARGEFPKPPELFKDEELKAVVSLLADFGAGAAEQSETHALNLPVKRAPSETPA